MAGIFFYILVTSCITTTEQPEIKAVFFTVANKGAKLTGVGMLKDGEIESQLLIPYLRSRRSFSQLPMKVPN